MHYNIILFDYLDRSIVQYVEWKFLLDNIHIVVKMKTMTEILNGNILDRKESSFQHI